MYPSHIYIGLRRASGWWHTLLNSHLVQLGSISKVDPFLLFRKNSTCILFILIYGDNILVTGSSYSVVQDLILHLGQVFAINDFGALNYFLGVEVCGCYILTI